MKHMCDPITKNPVLEGARPLVLKGEQPITTVCLGEEPNTSGVVDYVIGYPYKIQVAIHLLGIQQARRKAEKKIVTVYGVVSDRERYQFLRLDSQLSVSISAVMTADTDQNRNEIYRFLDHILEAALDTSPHTTPSKLFPVTEMKWEQFHGRRLFEGYYDAAIEDESDEEEDYCDIVRSTTPMGSTVTVKSTR
ncbi:MAG: hypothetical protein MMC33_003148 [Icmadophila ericetorum]|nr:hypothetical protein [Icmadophila ericetorum]